ncbi:hypothetical protein ARMA_2819 [Ardenticatena maritima]|uniref:Uncharacterized protein n=1 Tax=Ardenticatena maritima TaxID=872965 RepID=A0A0M8KBU9_9CHLR|nr:hypothetical protein ARMA_2819 [Ardenticatena maritima]
MLMMVRRGTVQKKTTPPFFVNMRRAAPLFLCLTMSTGSSNRKESGMR